jgi:hypothetical protein
LSWVIEISREISVSINAYAIGSEAITHTLSTLDATAIVLENKAQEILHGIYRKNSKAPNFTTITCVQD